MHHFAQFFEELVLVNGGLLADPVIEDIPILEEQDSDHSRWVVAVCPQGR